MLINTERLDSLPKNIISFLYELSRHENIRKLIVFGSRVHGDYNSKSDIDLAIEFLNNNETEIFKLIDFMESNLKSLLFLSLVDFNKSPEKLKQKILKEGVKIYEYSKN